MSRRLHDQPLEILGAAREWVVDLTVDGGVKLERRTGRDADSAPRDLAVNRQDPADAESLIQEPLPPEAASHPIVVGDIPLEPPCFQPMDGLLGELERASARVAVIHSVTGLRGVGTSQLAAAYARAKLASGWRLVAWVNGADAAGLQAGLAAVADATGLADGDSGHEIADAGQAVRHLLETDGDHCLLVFDDVADPEALWPFIPAKGASQVLITSTRQPPASLGIGVAMDVFRADEASAFLAARTGLDDEAGAASVAAELAQLPLALSLAAPVIAQQQVGYARYLDLLQAMPPYVPLTADHEQPYPPGVAQAVLLSLQAVGAADQTGVSSRVLEIVALLSAGGVRRELLRIAGQAGVLASGRRRTPAALVDRVLEWLSDGSLLTLSLDGQTVIMHPLVAQVIRDELDRRRRCAAVCRTTAFVLEAYAVALARSPDRPAVRDIPKHVAALLDNTAGLAGQVDDELAESLLRLRFIALYHLIELGDSAPQAIAIGEPLTAELEQFLGPDHPDTLNSRNSLAAAYLAVGRAADAIPLFEQTLVGRQRLLGRDHPDTLTSQNNLAAAYQDVGRAAEAIPLLERTLAVRERLLGTGHPSTLTSQNNLAVAYQDVGRAAEAIPLFERTLARRERVLGPDHPDTRTSRRHLAHAYQDAGLGAQAIPLLEQTSAGRKGILGPDRADTRASRKRLASTQWNRGRAAEAVPSAEKTRAVGDSQRSADAGRVHPVGLRWPPVDPASRVLPVGFRRPPVVPAPRLFSDGVAHRSLQRDGRLSVGRPQDLLAKDAEFDREAVAAMAAGDPTGIVMAYDRHAAGLYGYCRWMVHEADAAGALKDTFIVAAATISDLPEPSQLRPWLFALARNECQRRIPTAPATRDDEPQAADSRADGADQSPAPVGWLMDATMPFRVVSERTDVTREAIDNTMPFRVVSHRADGAREAIDATMPMPVVRAIDATMPIRVVRAIDATMPMRVVSPSIDPTGDVARVGRVQSQAELRTLISSILAGLRPREREVIELSFRHDLDDADLAVALGVSSSRARALASRARGQLENALDILLIALTRREACPVLAEVLAGWDGRLTKRTRNVVDLHLVQCQVCANHGQGALRPAAVSRLLPSAPLPPQLRHQILSRCFSTTPSAAAYRRSVVRRAESAWFAQFSEAIRWRWYSIRANPGAAIGTLAVVLWVVAAVSITMLIITGFTAAHARAAQPSVRTSSSSPAAPAVTETAPAAASARPSRTTRPSPAHVQPSLTPSAVPTLRTEPSPSPSPTPSQSPTPSTSPTSSKSPSPSPSHSGSPSASPSGSPSPSKTP